MYVSQLIYCLYPLSSTPSLFAPLQLSPTSTSFSHPSHPTVSHAIVILVQYSPSPWPVSHSFHWLRYSIAVLFATSTIFIALACYFTMTINSICFINDSSPLLICTSCYSATGIIFLTDDINRPLYEMTTQHFPNVALNSVVMAKNISPVSIKHWLAHITPGSMNFVTLSWSVDN